MALCHPYLQEDGHGLTLTDAEDGNIDAAPNLRVLAPSKPASKTTLALAQQRCPASNRWDPTHKAARTQADGSIFPEYRTHGTVNEPYPAPLHTGTPGRCACA
jgi:hypothetical protein